MKGGAGMTAKKHLNLLIDREQAERLERLAQQEDLSVSRLVRRAIDRLLDTWEAGQDRSRLSPSKEDPFLKVIGSFSSEPLSSREIDAELYECARS